MRIDRVHKKFSSAFNLNFLKMSSIIEKIKQCPTHLDYDGQRKAEKIFQSLILVFALAGLAFGYTTQQFSHTVYILGVGFVISCLLTLPPWPMYRCKPLPWLKPREESQEVQKAQKKKK